MHRILYQKGSKSLGSFSYFMTRIAVLRYMPSYTKEGKLLKITS